MDEIKEKIVQLKRMSEESKTENERLIAENAKLREEIDRLSNSDNVKKLEVERDLYKSLYEYMIERVIGGKTA